MTKKLDKFTREWNRLIATERRQADTDARRGKNKTMTHTWGWGTCGGKYPDLGKRKGMKCRILATGAKGSVHLEFEDGFRVITSRRGLRRIA